MKRLPVALLFALVCSVSCIIAWAQSGLEIPQKKTAAESAQATVTVIFGTEPRSVKATVYHGRKKLGKTPFEHKFDRDSGPVDLVFKAPGCVTVNTRVYTFQDTKLIVKMTKEEDRSSIYGYKEEIPPDAGVSPPSTSQPSLIPFPTLPSAPASPTKTTP